MRYRERVARRAAQLPVARFWHPFAALNRQGGQFSGLRVLATGPGYAAELEGCFTPPGAREPRRGHAVRRRGCLPQLRNWWRACARGGCADVAQLGGGRCDYVPGVHAPSLGRIGKGVAELESDTRAEACFVSTAAPRRWRTPIHVACGARAQR